MVVDMGHHKASALGFISKIMLENINGCIPILWLQKCPLIQNIFT